jgi:hypothetical protein
MSKLDKDTIVNNFSQAYINANGKTPNIEAKGGWYSVDGSKNMRLAQLEEMTAKLEPGQATAVEEKETPVKLKASVKKAASKTASKKTAVKTFSVKDFYYQQILQTNPGVKAPR